MNINTNKKQKEIVTNININTNTNRKQIVSLYPTLLQSSNNTGNMVLYSLERGGHKGMTGE